ncbi:hypothetical protein MMC27_001731 [Xylographa pallens]|nr:hypothetical protein [Xylographa pallens]
MKILESQSATLTNPEVLTHLLSLAAKPAPSSTATTTSTSTSTTPLLKAPNFETIRASLLEYLSPASASNQSTTTTASASNQTTTTPPSPLPDYTTPPYSAATTRALLARLRPYDLSKAELLMLVNLRPRDLGLLDCVVEECDERFGAGEQEGILRVVGGGEEQEGEGG